MKMRALTALTAVAVLATACGDDDTAEDTTAATDGAATSAPVESTPGSAPATTTASTGGEAGGAQIVAEGFEYQDVTVAPGATITLVNNDPEPHTVTADDGSFDSGPFQSDEPGELVAPTEPGEYPFHCEIHPGMQATLIVSEDAAGSTAGTTAPGETSVS